MSELHRAFSGLHLEVHENVAVLVEGDLVALRTIITGTHTGDYAGVAATGSQIQTSASHIFRVRDDELVEHWPVVDTYRILVAIGAIPPAASAFQQILGVDQSPGGLFPERRGTEFDYHIFLEAPHGTELARYGSPWASEIGITPQRGICTNPPTPNLWLCQCQICLLGRWPGCARRRWG